MPLNKPSGNMYPWAYTWNPLGGKCPHECGYCYVENKINPMMKRSGNDKYEGPLRLIEKELQTPLIIPEGYVIFVESCGDLFAAEVPSAFIQRVLDHIAKYPQTPVLLQTKNPIRFAEFVIPNNCILGTTIETTHHYSKTKAPTTYKRIEALTAICLGHKTMLSLEPIMYTDLAQLVNWVATLKPLFVSIGADSRSEGERDLFEPLPEDLARLIEVLKKYTEVKLKENLSRLLPSDYLIHFQSQEGKGKP
jgi:DNA repair photolyase